MARLLVLAVSALIIIYLTATQLSRSTTPTGQQTKTIIDKPDEVRQDVNKAMNVEKSREDAAAKTNP